jgi:PAS domain S-box-containing protein
MAFNAESTPFHSPADALEDLLERAGVASHLVSHDGIILRANRAELLMLGYLQEEYVGRSITELHADRTSAEAILARLHRNEPLNEHPARLRSKDGSIRQVVITSGPCVQSGGALYSRCLTVDVTARLQAEEISQRQSGSLAATNFEQTLLRRMEEQAAVFEFTEGLQHASSLDEICAGALDAILRALRCDRAGVLLFDRFGVLRFVAWRGLSESYRRAVEGHSPWTADTRDPRPICIPNVEGADLPASLKDRVRAEGINALAFMPVVENDRLIGKFMTYYDLPHSFADDEIDVALTIARHLGFALERERTGRAARQLVSIVESSDDAIVSKDLEGVITTWNNGAERLFGYTAEEAIGRPVTILIPPDRADEEPGILARIRRGERIDHYETLRRRKDGSLVDISLTVSPMRNAHGAIVGASKIARDITERKQAEARLHDSERQLRDLLAAIPAAIYTTDAAGKITYFNQMAVELAGRTPTIGTDDWCVTWRMYRPDGTPLPHDECPMAIALKEGRPIRNAEAVAERPDGTRVPFIPYPTPLRDADGKIIGAINMLVDVSERKQAETQQRVLFNELNHRVKNNMQMLQSLLHLASRRTRNPEAQQALGEASGRIAAMAAAQQVLYGTADAARFGARDFLDAVCRTAERTLPKDLKIVCEAAGGELPNDVAMPLALILNELLTNAAKHGRNSSGEGIIRVGLIQEEGSFVLYVEDEGPGFDLSSLQHRSSGLQLVQGLARQLRGQFEVSRTPATRCSVRFS